MLSERVVYLILKRFQKVVNIVIKKIGLIVLLSACKVSADVAFIVDSSGSIGRRKWPLVLDFLKKIINEFNVGPDGTHVAVVAYSTNAKVEFAFNAVSGEQITAEEYGKRIDRIRFQRGYTYIDKALKLANEQVFVTSAGMRPDVPKVYTHTFALVFLLNELGYLSRS